MEILEEIFQFQFCSIFQKFQMNMEISKPGLNYFEIIIKKFSNYLKTLKVFSLWQNLEILEFFRTSEKYEKK